MTVQISERLLYNGQDIRLCGVPLASHPTFKTPFPEVICSGCWRGYIGHWEIREETLWLLDVAGPTGGEGRLGIAFPDDPPPILAEWFTGGLRAIPGKHPEIIPGVYLPTHEDDSISGQKFAFGITQGKVLISETVDTQTFQVTAWELTRHLAAVYGHEEASFLRHIRSNLDDSTARLVYADWLEEREDSRADMLRLECSLAEATDSEREDRSRQAQQVWNKLHDRLWAQIVGIPHRDVIDVVPDWIRQRRRHREFSLLHRLEWSFYPSRLESHEDPVPGSTSEQAS